LFFFNWRKNRNRSGLKDIDAESDETMIFLSRATSILACSLCAAAIIAAGPHLLACAVTAAKGQQLSARRIET
jgi:hypothetical protein